MFAQGVRSKGKMKKEEKEHDDVEEREDTAAQKDLVSRAYGWAHI